MLDITHHIAIITSGVSDLMHCVAQTIGERHSCDVVGIYLVESGGQNLHLAGWLGDFDDLDQHTRQTDHLIHQTMSNIEARHTEEGSTWSAAISIRYDDSIVAALLIGSDASTMDPETATDLVKSLVGHIAIGIQVVRLRQRLDYAATQAEWDRITRQIHDGISSSIYSLLLHLEIYTEIAEREDSSFANRLSRLLPPTRQLMIDTCHYMYHLLPALTGESGLDRVLESLVAEFERTSEIPVHLSISGSASQVAISEVVGFCRVRQYHLAEILRNGGASKVRVDLEIESDNIRLMMWDNSHYDDAIEETFSAMRERVAQLAEDMGGDLQISNSFDMGVRVEVVLNTGSVSLDSFDNNRGQRISETGIADGPGNRERN